MKVLTALFAPVLCTLVTGCTAKSQSSAMTLEESLVKWSAVDLALDRVRPSDVRGVHVRYAEGEDGERTYLLCGEYRPANTTGEGWIAFAAVKTQPYTRQAGDDAVHWCRRSLPLNDESAELTDALKAKLHRAHGHGRLTWHRRAGGAQAFARR